MLSVEFAVTLFWNKTYHGELGRIIPFGYLIRYIARVLDKFLEVFSFSFIFHFFHSVDFLLAFSNQKYCVEKEMQ